ncbi:MAG: hypothetical protein KF847_02065 [Pirellulales bacterium]|nr:hypothetical protein [Pirellulales bacterium]
MFDSLASVVDASALSLREKLAQLMFVRLGSDMPPVRTADEDESRIAALLAEAPLGGLILFNGRHVTSPAALARLQAQSRVPLLVGADIERGYGQQLRPYPVAPHAMAFASLGPDAADAVRQFGELTAVASRRAGLHIAFAPVADVDSNPQNPIVSTRAFAADPARAAELAAALVEGCAAGGLLAAPKHFPGHGDTHEDSHHALPVVSASREELLAQELAPFRATIAAGAPLVMSAHVRYPALDGSGAPATLSRPILVDLLRDELGFTGAVVTDSMMMAGVQGRAAGEGELCVLAVNAGADALLDLNDPVAALAVLENAVDEGRLPLARVDEAAERILRLKRLAFVGDFGGRSQFASLSDAALRARTEELAERVAAAAIECAPPATAPLLDPARPLLAVLVTQYRSHLDPPEPPLAAALAERFPRLEFVELRGDEPPAQWEALAARSAATEQLLAAIVVKPTAWHRFGLPTAADRWLRETTERRPTVVACLGAPTALGAYPRAAVRLCTFSDVPVSQRALVRQLAGGDSA